jgi:hypothetical protein
MAKISYLTMTNRILRRISQDDVIDVTSVTAGGLASIILDLINEGQGAIFAAAVDWHSLYATQTFNTADGTDEYALASDFGRTIDLIDTTSNRVLLEVSGRELDESDPDEDSTSSPKYFMVRGSNYMFRPIPDGVYSIKDRYWKVPATLATNAATSDLPIECEICLLYWAWSEVLGYLNDFDKSDRVRLEYERLLKSAIQSNNRIVDRLYVMGGRGGRSGIGPPLLPSAFGVRY